MSLFLIRYNMILPKRSREALRAHPGTPGWIRERLPKGRYELTATEEVLRLSFQGSPDVLIAAPGSPVAQAIEEMKKHNFEVVRG